MFFLLSVWLWMCCEGLYPLQDSCFVMIALHCHTKRNETTEPECRVQKSSPRNKARALMSIHAWARKMVQDKIDRVIDEWSWIPDAGSFNKCVLDSVIEDLEDFEELIHEFVYMNFDQSVCIKIAHILNIIKKDFCVECCAGAISTPDEWKRFLLYQEERLRQFLEGLFFAHEDEDMCREHNAPIGDTFDLKVNA